MDISRGAWAALALLAAVPLAARADEEPALDARAAGSPGQSDFTRRGWSPRYDPRYQPEARQGLLVSFGLGGGSLYLSNQGPARFGAADLDLRLGYGFSDRFQMFMDFNVDAGSTYQGVSAGTWTWTVRGQTLLAGDRAGNGLNVNFGVGFGGLTEDPGSGRSAGPTGFALAGGLSYDARVTPWFAVSPEFFVTWHEVPNLPGVADDVSSIYGVRVNLLWYLH
ncbi:MAG TPA: hypothetical protein VFE90_24440 [Myxococcales bacterium]|jgi:hypothetical protein|nr:hypothetical protein [Myxococcales bacterium]